MTQRVSAATFRAQHGSPLPHPREVGGCKVRVPVIHERRIADMPALTEKQVQSQIVKALTLAGYRVFQTSQRRASGVTVGMPDLFVNIRGPLWLGMEVKRAANAPRSPEQKALEAAGVIRVVYSIDTAMEAVKDATPHA